MASSTFFGDSVKQETKSESKESASTIRLYLDFDGTLTLRRGSEAVFSNLYKTLQTKADDNYASAKFIEEQEMIKKLQAGFKEDTYKTMKLAEGSMDFLNEMISLGAEIVIISRNRKEYIRAVLLAEGMDQDKFAKIVAIKDVNDLARGKFGVVTDWEKTAKKATVTVVCDDDPNDQMAMKSPVISANSGTALVAYCESAGKFDWTKISKEIKEKAHLVAVESVTASMSATLKLA